MLTITFICKICLILSNHDVTTSEGYRVHTPIATLSTGHEVPRALKFGLFVWRVQGDSAGDYVSLYIRETRGNILKLRF